MKKLIVLFCSVFMYTTAQGQCAMCKAAAESNGNAGDSMAAGLNSGILYLMFIPYVLILVIAVLIYRHKKKLQRAKGA